MSPHARLRRSLVAVIAAPALSVGGCANQPQSPRRSFLAVGKAAAGLFVMMDVSLHKSVETVRDCVRRADTFKSHAAKGLL
jgi:hypothetical protein